MSAADEYQPGTEGLEGSTGPDTVDNDYKSRTGQKGQIPVQSDDAPIEDPIDANVADSDEQLGLYFPVYQPVGLLGLTHIFRFSPR